MAAATDFLDGCLARRWNVTTKLGSFLDTTADKLLVTVVLMALVAVDRASPWLARPSSAARSPSSACGGVAAAGGTWSPRRSASPRRRSSSWPCPRHPPARVTIGGAYLDQWAMLVAAVLTAMSGVDYLLRFSAALRPG